MDNNPITYILTTVKLDATGQRWIAALAQYHLCLHYKTGKSNVEVNAPSQIPWKENSDDISTIDEATSKAIIEMGTMGN